MLLFFSVLASRRKKQIYIYIYRERERDIYIYTVLYLNRFHPNKIRTRTAQAGTRKKCTRTFPCADFN